MVPNRPSIPAAATTIPIEHKVLKQVVENMEPLKNKLKHALIVNSKVTHLGNQSHEVIDKDKFDFFTNIKLKLS